MANNTIYKTDLLRGKTPTPDDFGYIPTGGEIYFDGSEAPNGWEETEDPTGGGISVYSKLLFYARTEGNDARTGANTELINQTQYNDYDDFLTYDSEVKGLKVKKPFVAIITPWVQCTREGGRRPEIGLCVNGNFVFSTIIASNSPTAIGGLEFSGYQSNICIYEFKTDDIISMMKNYDRGYAVGHLKIYKLFGYISQSPMDSLMATLENISYNGIMSADIVEE